MTLSVRAGSIATSLTLLFTGCDPAEPHVEAPTKAEAPAGTIGPASPEGPIIPSPVPSLPSTSKEEMKPDPPK